MKKSILLSIFLLAIIINTNAQLTARNFTLSYTRNLKGGVTSFGNTIFNAVTNGLPDLTLMNESGDPNNTSGGLGYSQYGNDQSDMLQVDIDNDPLTLNSSSANLVLPAGTNGIKFARLYWGGRIDASVVLGAPDTLTKVKIRKGTSGSYTSITAQDVITVFSTDSLSEVYQSYVDITSFIQANSSGTYTIADIPVSETDVQGGQYGGWAITVVYENPTAPYFSCVKIYDGFARIYNAGAAGSLGITLTNLDVPGTPLASNEAVMGTISWEGDANLSGDYIKINGIPVSNTLNPSTNFYNGSISVNGNYVTTSNPSYYNQMGIDIDEVEVGTGYNIPPNATSVDIEFGTTADQYFPSVFTFAIRVKDPVLTLNKTVSDADGNGYVNPSEALTYSISGANQGQGPSYNSYIVDTLPSTVTYVPGTLEVVYAPGVTSGFKTDAAGDDIAFVGTFNNKTYIKFYIGIGATANSGGTVPTDTAGRYFVRFKVLAAVLPDNVTNIASIVGESLSGEHYFNQGTAPIYVSLADGTSTNQNACNIYVWHGTTYSVSGQYLYTYSNANGSISTDTLNLVINHPSSSTTNLAVCSNATAYTWNGIVRNAPGTFTYTTTNSVGCDSIATLILTVKQTSSSSTSVAVCSNTPTYTWNGIVRNAPGTYTYTTTNRVGCDSVATLVLTVKQTSSSSTSVAVCSNTPTYTWNGIVRNAPGTYTYTTTNRVGCDSVATLVLTVKQTSTSSTSVAVCSNTPTYTWNGIVRNAPGTYTYTTTNRVGCDSVATLVLTVKQTSTSSTSVAVCSNTPTYTWNGIVRNAPGTYTYTTTNRVGCDSIATLVLTVKQTSTSSSSVAVCSNTPTYTWNGIVRNAPGTYTYTTTNRVGCDSIATLVLTVKQTSTSSSSVAVCSNTPTYTWNGIVRNAPGTYTYTTTNRVGCDSVATLVLTLKQTSTSTTRVAVCSNTPTYTWNGIVRNAPGTYTYTTTNSVGCDSVATLILTVKQTSSSSNSIAVCSNNPTYTWNGIVRNAPGTYNYTTTNSAGCDSVATLILSLKQTSSSSTKIAVCSNTPTYNWNGIIRNAPGTYTYTTTNSLGCDSVATLVLTVKQTSSSTTRVAVCSNNPTYTWNGIVRNAPGTYTYNTTNSVGCDSIATLVLTLKQTSSSSTKVAVCSNTPTYNWNGIIRNAPGTYTYTTTNSVGCDSVATLVLTLKQISTSTTRVAVCSNTPTYTWNGIVRNAPGTYTYSTTNSVGCDSIATLNLTVKLATTSSTLISICENQLPYVWNGLTFTQSGNQTAHFTNSVGCDSAATLFLTVKPTSRSTTNITICSSSTPYTWNGITFTQSGSQTATLVNSLGCDSLATLNLIVNPVTSSTTNVTICERELPYTWNGFSFVQTGTKTLNYLNSNGCDSTSTLNLTVLNCDPPCTTENFSSNPVGWTLSQGARVYNYNNPALNCANDIGIVTPGVGGFVPPKVKSPTFISTGARNIKVSFDIFVFDANTRCGSWKNYFCPTSIDVFYYIGNVRYIGILDFLLPPNGPQYSPNVFMYIPVGNTLPIGTPYSIEIVFKPNNGVGNCIQQNTKYVLDNFSFCELQCPVCTPGTTAKAPDYSYNKAIQSEDLYSKNEFSIWPVPTSNIIHLVSKSSLPVKSEIIDLSGKVILSSKSTNTIDVSKIKNGSYYLRIFSSNNIETKKIEILR